MEERKVYLKYGLCKVCGRWVPRDEMMVANMDFYDTLGNKTVIRHRYCPGCHESQKTLMQALAWDGALKIETEIRADERLAALAGLEYDPTLKEEAERLRELEEELRADVKARRTMDKVRKQAAAADDSEGALRKKGLDVPEPVER